MQESGLQKTIASHPSSAKMEADDRPKVITWARCMVAHDMGLKDEKLLDDNFVFVGPLDG